MKTIEALREECKDRCGKVSRIINWKSFFTLLGACAISSLFVVPYQAALLPGLAEMGAMLYVLAFAQSLVVFSIVTFFGLLLARKMGLSLLVLEGENKWENLKAILMPSALLGVLSGVLIILADFAFQGLSISLLQEEMHVSIWAAFLASFYGGIAEEVLMRLFVMTFFVWLISKIARTKEGLLANWIVWVAIVLSSVLFGLGHLPMTSALTAITAIVVVRAVVLNGIGGVVFGWLYWKKGLMSAMIAHFFADIVLHVITPVVVGMFI